MARYFVGLDLGQSRDYTAIAAVERAEETGAWDPLLYAHRRKTVLRVRHLERVPLGTSYPDIVERVRDVVRSPDLAGDCHLVVDATGVGRPVVDLLQRRGLGCNILSVMITGADAESSSGGYYRVPKRDLIVGVQLLLQREALQIAGRLPAGPTLVKEMRDMRVKVTLGGKEQYGAWREGEHDDLVLAVALGCWGAKKVHPWGAPGEEGW